MLNRCQKEFENRDEEFVKEKEAALEKTATEAERKKLKEELDEVLSKAKRRSLGNIRLVYNATNFTCSWVIVSIQKCPIYDESYSLADMIAV